jgi:hypothetical protein
MQVIMRMNQCSVLHAALLLLTLTAKSTMAWMSRSVVVRHSTTELSASRRDTLAQVMAVGTTLFTPQLASAEIDYAKVQDLLGNSVNSQIQSYTPTTGRPTWLTEPTEDFKLNEQKASDFKRKQVQQKADFQKQLDLLQETANDEAALLEILDNLRMQVKLIGGLPTGIVKEDLVKQIRRRKARKPKFWPTEVEIA